MGEIFNGIFNHIEANKDNCFQLISIYCNNNYEQEYTLSSEFPPEIQLHTIIRIK